MAKFRQVHTKIWKDDWFCEIQPNHKLFFIYLFTNELASISGIYELPKRIMSFESGLSFSEIDDALAALSEAGRVEYCDGVVWVKNLRKYHETGSPKVQSCIAKDVQAVKDCEIKKKYLIQYPIDTLLIPSGKVSIPRSSSSSSSSSSSIETANEKTKSPLITAYENTFGTITYKAQQVLFDDEETYGTARVIEAIGIARERGAKSYAYAAKVLEGKANEPKKASVTDSAELFQKLAAAASRRKLDGLTEQEKAIFFKVGGVTRFVEAKIGYEYDQS